MFPEEADHGPQQGEHHWLSWCSSSSGANQYLQSSYFNNSECSSFSDALDRKCNLNFGNLIVGNTWVCYQCDLIFKALNRKPGNRLCYSLHRVRMISGSLKTFQFSRNLAVTTLEQDENNILKWDGCLQSHPTQFPAYRLFFSEKFSSTPSLEQLPQPSSSRPLSSCRTPSSASSFMWVSHYSFHTNWPPRSHSGPTLAYSLWCSQRGTLKKVKVSLPILSLWRPWICTLLFKIVSMVCMPGRCLPLSPLGPVPLRCSASWSQTACVQSKVPSLTLCVTLNKLFHHFRLFLHFPTCYDKAL